jgi:hypothetical protein
LRCRGKRGAGKEAAPCVAKKREIFVLLKCKETQIYRDKILNDKWLYINEEIAHKEIISCTTITELKNFGKLISKLKCK